MNFLENLSYPSNLLEIHIDKVNKVHGDDIYNYYDNHDEIYQANLEKFMKSDCDYYFFVDSNIMIKNSNIIMDLLSLDKNIVGPMARFENKFWTNFWGSHNDDYFYERSNDYVDIINNRMRSCWNVPYLTSCYLVKR